MHEPGGGAPRLATTADADVAAQLLHTFNREFGVPTPGPAVLKERLLRLLAGDDVVVLLMGDPPVALALLTLRPNVWYEGPVGLLEELYVVPEMRGRGLGSALLDAVEAVTSLRGGELLEINVDGEDTAVRSFYEGHGYTCHEPGEPAPDLCYSKELR